MPDAQDCLKVEEDSAVVSDEGGNAVIPRKMKVLAVGSCDIPTVTGQKHLNRLPELYPGAQQQPAESDTSGLHALVNLTDLVFGGKPSEVRFAGPKMRKHIKNCLAASATSVFPESGGIAIKNVAPVSFTIKKHLGSSSVVHFGCESAGCNFSLIRGRVYQSPIDLGNSSGSYSNFTPWGVAIAKWGVRV
ncbi:hypothetical protein RvY_11750 [Ramazzottius varieornatus]|uniref:Uncharacterized protein n=1 Tax=Ramazzottius varieornatus TaxID=947166 RepID=A0A1D1VJ64_RAMVA|nr:hypothetical protein RvY_11750 [Ramazzottius varieornatus]